MYSVWLSDDEQRVWRAYLAMTAGLQAEMSRQLSRDCGLSLAEYDVLVALDERPECRISELGDRLGWEQSRLSHQLSRMRTRGLIARKGASDDRRAATVDLTDDGRSALRAAAPGHAELVRSVVFEGMSTEQARALTQWTSAVLERLGHTAD
ncbi:MULTISPECIES: MarR family winged helix-turn-helix transcriptional regulator [unclassified Mycolicibacterium]|uniref:MarR family winged helix-turn-helix transcriptional regulator n=1 Tax=unclassified Mycolicibacterium TaxID=2636767 RepID=UPI001F4BE7AC|nr:MarR family winged helix-turn-helix transcriptional regulator [Mycolicibacterium sp. YH-1]UNB52348.1 MarR family winged helix-turn-helix transcriptional regulator [Mycolicibacterium sp. YH-1]